MEDYEQDDDILETKPSIMNLLNRLYETSSMNESNQSDSRRDSESPDEQTEQKLVTLPSDMRATLEDRFIELVQQFPCFYNPNDKNFCHNQHKSNTYALISKKLCAEGLETSGTQLATLFKSMKAKYRDESRRLARDPDLLPSPFYKKLGFLETGLNSVDQRLAKFRVTNGHNSTTPPLISTKDGSTNEKYVSVIAYALDKFSPEMKEGFLNFITALNDLNEPIKHLDNFTQVARKLKTCPNSSVEVSKPTSSSNGISIHNPKSEQISKDSNIGELIPDLESMGHTFKSQKDLLALFRVLGNVVTKLPVRRRHSHLQGLLNISSAALHSPVQISWQSEVFKPVEKCWTTFENTITIDGPSPNESNGHQKEESVEAVPAEPKRNLKRRHQEESDESDNDSVVSIITNESAKNGRFPRAAKSNQHSMSPNRKIKRR